MFYCQAHLTLSSVIFSLCFLLVSHKVFSIRYPKSIQRRGSTLGFWCINFFPNTFMHWVTIFKDKPPIQWGLWACTCWWKNIVQFGLRSIQFLFVEILLAQPFVPLQHCCFSLPLLQAVKQGGSDKCWVLAASGLRLGCPVPPLALHKQEWQPLSSGMRPLALLHRISPQPGHPLQHLPDVFIALPETAFTPVLLQLLSLKQTQLMSHLS